MQMPGSRSACADPVEADLADRLTQFDRSVEPHRPVHAVHFATFIGHLDRALDHLRITTDGGFFNASYLGSDPWVDPMRSEPRFQEMLRAAQARQDAIDRQLQARVEVRPVVAR